MAIPRVRVFRRPGASTERTLVDLLRGERVGGVLLLVATVAALVAANGPWAARYDALGSWVPFHGSLSLPTDRSLHLDLTLGQWVTDGVLALFFFVVGLELKREIVVGELRRPATAIVPIGAAIGGMVAPALVYLAVNATQANGSLDGWAVPTATDIAFALAVLTVVGKSLPSSLRAFLLTLAIVDDLLAILIIAVFYSQGLDAVWLVPAAAFLTLVWLLTRRRVTRVAILFPLAFATWLCVHESGIHATIAGVALGLVVPATRRAGEKVSPVEHWEHRWGPVSEIVAVPMFAFFAAGASLSLGAIADAARDPAAQGVAAGLVFGKPAGIILASLLIARFENAHLPRGMSWWDVAGIAGVGGIGFTVSLLIGGLAFGSDGGTAAHVKAAVLVASAIAAVAGGAMLAWRDRVHAARKGSG